MKPIFRTDLQDERQINHHGKVRTVKGSDDDLPPVETMVNKIQPEEIYYDKDLVSIDEKKQDNALKEYYRKVVITSDTKKRILSGCIMFSRQVKPVIAALFVISYWSAGLWNYSRVE